MLKKIIFYFILAIILLIAIFYYVQRNGLPLTKMYPIKTEDRQKLETLEQTVNFKVLLPTLVPSDNYSLYDIDSNGAGYVHARFEFPGLATNLIIGEGLNITEADKAFFESIKLGGFEVITKDILINGRTLTLIKGYERKIVFVDNNVMVLITVPNGLGVPPLISDQQLIRFAASMQ